MPNGQQMDALCQHHYEVLTGRNPLLASYYDVISSLPARPADPSRSAYSVRQQPGQGAMRRGV